MNFLISLLLILFTSIGFSLPQNDVQANRFVLKDPNSAFKTYLAPSSPLTANFTLTLPPDAGLLNQALVTDGTGLLSWISIPGLAANFDDTLFYVFDNVDPTIQVHIDATGTTGTKTTIQSSQTVNQISIIPNQVGVSDTFVMEQLAQIVDNKTLDLTTNTFPGFTAGSVLFHDGSSIAQDNTKLFWDNTNKFLGIGTNTPNSALHVANDAQFDATIGFQDIGSGFFTYMSASPSLTGDTSFVLPPTDGSVNSVLLTDGFGNTSWSTSPNGTFADNLFTIFDNVDNTKIAQFQLASQTTGLTRTTTMPDYNGTMVSDPGWTTGSVLFKGAAGYVTEDNTNLFWDDTNDVLKLRNSLYQFGSTDPFGRRQIWNYDTNAVLRLGSLGQDGDPSDSSSEGIISYGQNAQGDPMSSATGDFGYARVKPMRFGLYNSKTNVAGYIFRVDPTSLYLTDNAYVKTFEVTRSSGNIVSLGTANFTGSITSKTSLVLEDPGAGTNTVTIQSGIPTASYSLTLPVDDGTPGQVLSTDGSGILSWVSSAGNSFVDNLFNIYDNVDNTKILQFQVAGITTGTTRTLSATDANGYIVTTPTAPTYSDGDMLYVDTATSNQQYKILPIGTPGQVLTVSAGNLPTWAASAGGGGSAEGIPAGAIVPFAGTAVPTGWLDCDGAAVSRTTYAELFAVLGTTYGVGDGSTTFNVPDQRTQFSTGPKAGLSGFLLKTVSGTTSVTRSALTTKTANYTILNSDAVILGDTTSGSITFTLPTAVGNTGIQFNIKKIATANNLIIDGAGTETIDGQLTQTLTTIYTSITIVSDGVNWLIL